MSEQVQLMQTSRKVKVLVEVVFNATVRSTSVPIEDKILVACTPAAHD